MVRRRSLGRGARHPDDGEGSTSAYVPLGATMVTDTIAEYFENHTLYAGLTTRASVGCAAAVACINVYKEDHRSRMRGRSARYSRSS
jgi:adenosylmethionine-8-amino-7-oxononanoate aminotransferase